MCQHFDVMEIFFHIEIWGNSGFHKFFFHVHIPYEAYTYEQLRRTG
jgi:hypothetical protein